MKYEIKLSHKDYLLLLDTLTEACKSATDIKSIMRLSSQNQCKCMCFTLSRTSARFALLKRSRVPTR